MTSFKGETRPSRGNFGFCPRGSSPSWGGTDELPGRQYLTNVLPSCLIWTSRQVFNKQWCNVVGSGQTEMGNITCTGNETVIHGMASILVHQAFNTVTNILVKNKTSKWDRNKIELDKSSFKIMPHLNFQTDFHSPFVKIIKHFNLD